MFATNGAFRQMLTLPLTERMVRGPAQGVGECRGTQLLMLRS
jgi:hypothetical protein